MDLFLTQAEIDELCKPLTQPAAQIRYLRQVLKLTVNVKPNRKALVVRSHAEAVLSGLPPSAAPIGSNVPAGPGPRPDIEGFLRLVGGDRKQRRQTGNAR